MAQLLLSPRVIASGSFTYNSINDFLGEMFHLDHGDAAQQVCVCVCVCVRERARARDLDFGDAAQQVRS